MKSVLFLVLVGVSTVLAADLGVVIEKFLNKLKDTLPCGFDGSTSLAPYILADGGEKIHIVDIQTPDFVLDLNIEKFKIIGANSFQVKDSVYDADTQEYTFNLVTPAVTFEIAYDMKTKLNSSYVLLDVDSKGSYHIEMKETNLHAKIMFGADEDGLLIRDMEIVESFLPQEGNYDYGPELQADIDAAFVQKDEKIDNAIRDFLLPKLNNMLIIYKTVEELAADIEEMTGGDDEGLFGGEKC